MEVLFYDPIDMLCAVKKRYPAKLIDFLCDTCNEINYTVDKRLLMAHDLDFLSHFNNTNVNTTRKRLNEQLTANDYNVNFLVRYLLALFDVVKRLTYEDQVIVCDNFNRIKYHANFTNHKAVRECHEREQQADVQERVFEVVLQKQSNM
jgi:hypothetical protein